MYSACYAKKNYSIVAHDTGDPNEHEMSILEIYLRYYESVKSGYVLVLGFGMLL